MPKLTPEKKARVIWIVKTGGVYDRIFHDKPANDYIKRVTKMGCTVVKFKEVIR